MSNPETAVREAALALWAAIDAARKSGLVITWPSRPEGLTSLAISAGAVAPYSEAGSYGPFTEAPKARKPRR